ncbi:P63C domain-containing protein [uncultured Bacteroides sp.]|uniref:P63C domain-containing protein n=1 Tax=uncultured Bacteroides sp. TaxID=162156 RepID=UPI002676548B|nr:P63C domain-containing protein [uncultured Bacteroides sp.]
MEEKNIIKYDGELNLNGLKISCYVLQDGRRILSTSGMQKALAIVNDEKERSSGRLAEILSSKNVSACISNENLSAKISPILCYRGAQKIAGYEASVLPEICEIMLKVRDYAVTNNIELGSRQKAVIVQSDIIIRALARVGIIALVDEATGYQYDREKDELQKILKAYISEELLPWQKRFPDVFYKELFRLNGWDFTVNGIKKRPGIIGKWTNMFIYEELPNGVLDELKKKTPKSESGNRTSRYHQLLTLDIGEPNLEKQINKVITLFQVSDNMKQFCDNFKKMKMRQIGQMELPFEFDENGYTKD